MEQIELNRRACPRYDMRLALRYRISQKIDFQRWSTGMTCELSVKGLSFETRRDVPVGSHIEIRVDWPAKHGENAPLELRITGVVIRSVNGKVAVRAMSHRFLAESSWGEVQVPAIA
jgi:hypothetical protein